VLRREELVHEIHEPTRHAIVHRMRNLPEILAMLAGQDADSPVRKET